MSRLVTAAVLVLALAGCSPAADAPALPSTTAADIADIDQGIAWARGLDESVSARELSAGINAIGELVPEQDIWFATNNELGIALVRLNADVLGDPGNAGSKVDDLNVIVDDLEAAIAHGDNP